MPFVPLDPEEEKGFKEPCSSPEHDPPSHMVITRPMKWVCPSCGATVILRPSSARLGVSDEIEMVCRTPEQNLTATVTKLTPEQIEKLRSAAPMLASELPLKKKLAAEQIKRLSGAKQLVNLRRV